MFIFISATATPAVLCQRAMPLHDGMDDEAYTLEDIENTLLFCACNAHAFFAIHRYYSVNVPLHDGMDDEAYHYLFKPIMTKIMENYQPGAIVLQSGEF